MDKRGGAAEPGRRQRQLLEDIAKIKMPGVRNAIGMGADLAVENEYLPPRQAVTQMIVGAPVAEAELEHAAGQVCD